MAEENETPKRNYVTNTQLQLELKALRSDLRLLIVGSLVANQVLSNITIPGVVTAAAAVGGGIWLGGKLALIALTILKGA